MHADNTAGEPDTAMAAVALTSCLAHLITIRV